MVAVVCPPGGSYLRSPAGLLGACRLLGAYVAFGHHRFYVKYRVFANTRRAEVLYVGRAASSSLLDAWPAQHERV